MTPTERITARANRNGPVDDPATQRPLLTLEEFFEGNEVSGSIGCNLSPVPHPADMYASLNAIRSRPDVADVRVQITTFDDPEWPFSDTVWVVTSVTAAEVMSWFDESLAPDDTWTGWTARTSFEPVDVPGGMSPVACWWD